MGSSSSAELKRLLAAVVFLVAAFFAALAWLSPRWPPKAKEGPPGWRLTLIVPPQGIFEFAAPGLAAASAPERARLLDRIADGLRGPEPRLGTTVYSMDLMSDRLTVRTEAWHDDDRRRQDERLRELLGSLTPRAVPVQSVLRSPSSAETTAVADRVRARLRAVGAPHPAVSTCGSGYLEVVWRARDPRPGEFLACTVGRVEVRGLGPEYGLRSVVTTWLNQRPSPRPLTYSFTDDAGRALATEAVLRRAPLLATGADLVPGSLRPIGEGEQPARVVGTWQAAAQCRLKDFATRSPRGRVAIVLDGEPLLVTDASKMITRNTVLCPDLYGRTKREWAESLCVLLGSDPLPVEVVSGGTEKTEWP